ncbi:HTH_48 domain-containing protein [Trichonephila inaurata madagascariensis]|uniref:HTH_48 domain-containing protein n=1 Tax=Trichonephila inaurata madagascariensis TaxID=2747483 RepID=A0A8X7CPX5_9ARAC|nr:HTH_48 domain-containing protein [Trichonephila inaurata madagascariensis]
MAFALQNSTIEEQRSVIRFLTATGEKPAAIHRRMVTVYGEKCVSDKSVRKWSARFRAGRESVGDDQRPGQANTVITSDLIDKVGDHSLKKQLKGKRFTSDDVLKDTVKDWVSPQPQEFWEQGILRLVYQWDRCAQAYGVYFE